jgi:2-keto-4-pentenoate hydratase/2-oxohepta-3-ene-1,7-dioic acid hydratase in catechol pathway
MRLVTFTRQGGPATLGALADGDATVIDLGNARGAGPALASMRDLMAAGPEGLDHAREVCAQAQVRLTRDEVRLVAPVPVPAQIRDFLCFEEHMLNSFAAARAMVVAATGVPPDADLEARFQIPPVWYQQPIYYKGNRFSCIGPDADIVWPAYAEHLDYELEIGCWIGQGGRDIPAADAAGHVFGYSVFNDMTARDAQMTEMSGQLGPAKGKDFDTGNVIGPCIVTSDEIDIGDLTMVARINGEEVSRGSSGAMHWTFPDVIEHVSRCETLHPGEMLGSGTVGGGCAFERGERLAPGDVIELEVEGIGVLRNRVVREQA